MKSFEKQSDIKSVQISISSPQEIQARSNGEVLNSKSLNYKTMNPEKGGLFCEIIFGPMKEYECRCGALQGLEYAGKKCNLCGVEVNSSRLRRYRMGHINLVVPIPHVWFLKIRPFYLNTLIGLKLRQLDQILLAKNEVVLNVKQKKIELFLKDNITNSNSEINQVIDVSKTVEKKRSRIRTIRGSGSEVLYHYLTSLDLSQEYLVQRQLLLENVSFQNFNQISADLLDTFDYNLSNSNTSISLLSKSNRGTVNPLNFHIFLRSQSFLLQLKRLKILEYFLCNKRRPEWMMLKVLPILPPELRPFLIMENNLVVSSDLNLLYKRIVERSHRLKAIYKLGTPLALQLTTTTFICNELAMLQHAVDSLIDNGRRGKAMLNKKRIPLKSLTHILKGKEGRFRMNLLGKRVDLSARTVISVGPRLKLTQCGLPISIALVLFKSLIYKKINPYSSIGLKYKAGNVVNSKYRFKESSMNNYTNSSRLLAQIDELVYFNPLLLNRAPTLHRLNVQPFQPIMINNKAIQLHPLVCSSFNADFDGDQMAVHLPLSLSSQIEARILMMTYNNIISIANGSVIIMPSQDIVFGLYYATMTYSNNVYEHHFYSIKEVQNALLEKIISLHTPIKLWVNSQNNKKQFYITTPGRVLLYSLLPVNSNYKEGIQNVISFERINKIFNKKGIHDLIQHIYYHSTKEQFLYFLDHLMAYGFYNAHRAAISLSVQDVVIPSIKNRLIQRAKQSYKDYTLHLFEQNNLNSNNLTGNVSDSLPNSYKQEQLKKRMVSSWSDAQSRITSLIVKDVNESQNKDKPPIYMLIHSGARGSILQMRQLSGLRGLMVKPSGDLIEMPISSNFREGLRVVEYFYSTHGARKGVIDTSIRTATSGYLTRRLVHATQDLIITEEDCGTIRGIPIVSEFSNGKEIRSLINLALGRTVSHNVYEPTSNKLIFGRNSMITWVDSEKLKHIEKIYVRSPLVCESKEGVCKLCYGSNLSNGKLISLGEAIGILASQSIGEPGTQLTMRTFHMGGVLLGESSTSTIRSGSRGRVYLKYGLCLPLRFDNLTEFNDLKFMNHGQEIDLNISLSSFFEIVIVSEDYHITNRYQVPYGSVLFCKDGSFVEKGDLLYKTNANYEPIIYKDIKEGYLIYKGAYSSQNSSILETVSQNHNIISKKEVKIQRIIIQNQKGDLLDTSKEIKKGIVKQLTHVYYLQDKDLLIKQNKTRVSLGSILFLIPRNAQGRGDITGGLSKISQLFESSLPFKERILAKRKGIAFAYPYDTLKNRKEGKGSSWKITLFGEKLSNESTLVTYNTAMRIRSYSFIKKGESLAFENPSLLEVLQVYGVATAIYKLKKDVISIYLENGVSIHDKHIELVLRRMFNRVQILDRGSTSYMVREEVDNNEFIKENILALSKGLFMAKASLVTRGVTYISLESKSFLSAASFQNTAQVLSSAALQGKIDHLKGLSENVILGRLIPVGSGTIIQ